MSVRLGVVLFSALFVLGCAHDSGGSKRRKLDRCDCENWGVVGVDPGPGYKPPPLPLKCKRMLKKSSERNCPVPP